MADDDFSPEMLDAYFASLANSQPDEGSGGGSAGSPDVSGLLAALTAKGIDPNLTIDEAGNAVLLAQGRERARPRYQQALDRAQQYGYQELASRIESMVETEAQRHAKRGMKRSGGIGSDAVAAKSAPAPARPSVVAPPLPVPGSPSPMPMTLTGMENAPPRNPAELAVGQAGRQGDPLGPIDWTAPAPGPGAPRETAGTLTPVTDRVAPYVGSEIASRVVAPTERFLQGNPGYQLPAALSEGDMGRAAGNAALIAAPYVAGPVAGAVGRAMTAAPRTTGALVGGAALATPAATQQQAGMTATQRQDRTRELNAEIAKREKTLEGFATRNFQSKTAREAVSKPHLDAIQTARDELKDIRSGADAEAAAKRQADADKKWNESAITQRYPWLVPAAGTAGFLGGSMLANSMARNAVRRYNTNVNDLNARWGGAVDTARNARTQGGRDAGITQAESFRDQFRDMTRGAPATLNPRTWFGHGGPSTGGATLAPVAGTEIGVGLPTLADEWMAYSTPHGSPAREHSRQFWSDPASIAGRFAPGMIAGGAMGKTMGMAAKRNVSEPLGFYGETAGLRHLPPLGRPPSPQSPPPTTSTPTPSGSRPTTPMNQPAPPPDNLLAAQLPQRGGAGPENALARLGGQRPASGPFESNPPPAPRGTRQAEGPPEGAVWNHLTQRWHVGNRIVGGANRWPAPARRDWNDYSDE